MRIDIQLTSFLLKVFFLKYFLPQGKVGRSPTQQAMPAEFGEKWRTECLDTRYSLPTVQPVGYRMKRKKSIKCDKIFN